MNIHQRISRFAPSDLERGVDVLKEFNNMIYLTNISSKAMLTDVARILSTSFAFASLCSIIDQYPDPQSILIFAPFIITSSAVIMVAGLIANIRSDQRETLRKCVYER